MTDRRGLRQHAWDGNRRLDRHAAHLVRIARNVDTERHIEADFLLGVGPVHHALRDEALVRDEHLASVAGDDRDAAGVHRVDPAVAIADRDDVARLDRLVHEQDHAADEIGHDLLQAETQADAERPGEDRERREIDSGRPHHDQDRESHQREAQQLADENPQRRRQVGRALHAAVEKIADGGRHPHREDEQQDRLEDQQGRHAQAADFDGD